MSFILCTNAPKVYCETVLGRMNIPIDELFDACFTSDAVGLVKPMKEFYRSVESDWTKFNDTQILFIDDSPLNIQALAHHPNWTGYHVNSMEDVVTTLKNISDSI